MKKRKLMILSLLGIGLMLFTIQACEKDDEIETYETMSDIDGNIYKVITIGNQTWMAENLKVTKYNNGEEIPVITDNTEWNSLSYGALCNYNNTENVDSINVYGKLYNGFAVQTGNLAPEGWHIPSQAEWLELESYCRYNGLNMGIDSLNNWVSKSLCSTWGWKTSRDSIDVGYNQLENNASGFTVLPNGYRDSVGVFYRHGETACYWNTTDFSDDSDDKLGNCILDYDYPQPSNFSNKIQYGLSIRCVKD